MPRGLKIFLRTILGLVFFVAVAVGGYLLYLQAYAERIADEQIVRVEGNVCEQKELSLDTTYTAITYNIGFGAYDPSFSFFMEEGTLKDGTKTRGTSGKAASSDSVRSLTERAIAEVASAVQPAPVEVYVEEDLDPWNGIETEPVPELTPTSPDFMLFQEVDSDSDRSYHVDQKALIKAAFPSYSAYFAENFHTGFIVLPLHDMHGRVKSGLLTLTDVAPSSVVRRSFPIDESIPARFIDLDRCFCVMRVPVAQSGELVLINHHMSAYGSGDEIRAEQLSMLTAIMSVERAQGSHVIVGGDWNHALYDSIELYPSEEEVPNWLSDFDEAELPEGFAAVRPDNVETVATCRSSDMPFTPGRSYQVSVDGFVVSDNVEASATILDTGFGMSDHNPVLLSFRLAA